MHDSEWPLPKQEFTTGRLIGLGGLLRSGKDTAADHLVDRLGYVKFGMSDSLNDFLVAQNPIVSHHLESRWEGMTLRVLATPIRYADYLALHGYVAAKASLEEFREIMQRTGTEAGRNVLYENVWVDAIKRKIQAAAQPVVVTGIRFPNEIEMIRSLGGETVWIDRPAESDSKDLTDLDRAMTRHPAGKALKSAPVAAQHASETSVSPSQFKWTVVNGGSVEDLHRQIEIIARGTNQ